MRKKAIEPSIFWDEYIIEFKITWPNRPFYMNFPEMLRAYFKAISPISNQVEPLLKPLFIKLLQILGCLPAFSKSSLSPNPAAFVLICRDQKTQQLNPAQGKLVVMENTDHSGKKDLNQNIAVMLQKRQICF
jgi:hypothetical protein